MDKRHALQARAENTDGLPRDLKTEGFMVLTHSHKAYGIIQLVGQRHISGGSGEDVFVLAPFMKFLCSVKYHLIVREGTPWDSPRKRNF